MIRIALHRCCRVQKVGNTSKFPFHDTNKLFGTSAVSDGAFVSKHFKVSDGEMIEVLQEMDTEIRENSNSGNGKIVEVKECKLCIKSNKNKLDNLWKLFVRCDGSYYCYRCSQGGSWFDLKSRVREPREYNSLANAKSRGGKSNEYRSSNQVNSTSNYSNNSISKSQFGFISAMVNGKSSSGYTSNGVRANEDDDLSSDDHTTSKRNLVFPDQNLAKLYNHSLFPFNEMNGSSNVNAVAVREYLFSKRGLKKDVLVKYGVGMVMQKFLEGVDNEWVDKICITFPWMRLLEEDDIPKLDEQLKSSLLSNEMKSDRSPFDRSYVGEKYIFERIKLRYCKVEPD